MGEAGRTFVEDNRGALQRLLLLLAPFLPATATLPEHGQ